MSGPFTLSSSTPAFSKIRYVFQGTRLLPEVLELDFRTHQATLRGSGQAVYFTEVRDHAGNRLRLVDLFHPSVTEEPAQEVATSQNQA